MKILVAIANHGTKNDGFARRLIDEYRSMSHDVDVVVLSNLEKDWGPDVEVRVGYPTRNPWSLPFAHKQLFADRKDRYDLFIYSEDDTLVTERNIDAFVETARVLPDDQIPGFLRFEESPEGELSLSSIHSHFCWSPDSVQRVNGHTFAHFSNDHSACFLLTRAQLERAIDSGGFLVEPHEGRYDMLCSAATDPYTRCGMKRMICLSRIRDFLLAHLPNVYLGRMGVSLPELEGQITALEAIARGELDSARLLAVETQVQHARWSKNCYEGPNADLEARIPPDTRSLLSVGSGMGGTEAGLVAKGVAVTAIPVDAVLGSAAASRGVEVLPPDLDRALAGIGERHFDVVLLHQVLYLLPDPVAILRRLAPRVAPGGRVVISVPNFDYAAIRYRRLRRRPGFIELTPYARTGLHLTRRRVLGRWCRDAGLVDLRHCTPVGPQYSRHHRALLGLFPRWFGETLWTVASPPVTRV